MVLKKLLVGIVFVLSLFLLVSCAGNGDGSSSDSTPKDNNTEDVASVYPAWELNDEAKAQLYKKAQDAETDSEYQYAYAVFSVLAKEGYSDSEQHAKQLRAEAFATKLLSDVPMKNVVGGKKCSVTALPDNYESIIGILYIADGGVPTFAYYDSEGKCSQIVPDTSLTDVISIANSPDGYKSTGETYPHYYTCLKKDGTVSVIYNEKQFPASEEYNRFKEYIEYTSKLKNVCKIDHDIELIDALFLHGDGSVSCFKDEKLLDQAVADRFANYSDYSNIMNGGDVLLGIKADGSTISESKQATSNDDKELLLKQGVVLDAIFHGYYTVGGHVYRYGVHHNADDALKYKNAEGTYEPFDDIVFIKANTFVGADGKLCAYNGSALKENIDNIAFIVDDRVYICSDGSVLCHDEVMHKYPYKDIKVCLN